MDPPAFRFYVVFHSFLRGAAYEKLNFEYISRYCRFIGVNRQIEKKVLIPLLPYIQYEWDLPNYNPLYQHCKFYENSVLYHTAMNQNIMLDLFEYVGFLQYDMILDNSLFETVKNYLHLHPDSSTTIFYHQVESAGPHLDQGPIVNLNMRYGYEIWSKVIELYNNVYSKSFTIEEVLKKEIPLYNCFLLPKGIFKEMMVFSQSAFPIIFDMLGDIKHLPYQLERCHGVFLLLHTLDKKIETWLQLPGIHHSSDLKEPS